MTQEELNEILKKHKLWLRGEPGGERANLTRACLIGMNMTGADMTDACLIGACLIEADLTGANMTGTDLDRAIFTFRKKSEDLILKIAEDIKKSRRKKRKAQVMRALRLRPANRTRK